MDIETILREIAFYYTRYALPYITAEYHGQALRRFDLSHLVVMGVTFLLALILLLTSKNFDEDDRDALRETMAQILIINEIVSYLWFYFYQGTETVKVVYGIPIKLIPFNLVNFFAWVAAFMLLKKRKKLYEFVYFIGIPVALYALIFPVAQNYGFPHYRFFYTLITPAMILLSAIYMTAAEDETTLNWQSLLRVFITANLIAAIVYGINVYFGSNYLYLNAKPTDRILLSVLPAYPTYLVYLEAIGILSGLILYIPVFLRDWMGKRNSQADAARIDKFV
jgi:hypothetical integral membrane protein (TIGR02206 family)